MSSNVRLTLIFMVGVFVAAIGYGQTQKFECPAGGGTLSYVVAEGDDVWGIAERNCSGNIQNAVDYIVAKYGTVIHPGQQINLP